MSTKSCSDSSYELLFRGSSFALRYSSPSGPIAVTCVTYSPDFAQWKMGRVARENNHGAGRITRKGGGLKPRLYKARMPSGRDGRFNASGTGGRCSPWPSRPYGTRVRSLRGFWNRP